MHDKNVEKLLAFDKKKLFTALFGENPVIKDISYYDDIRNQTYIIGDNQLICKLYADDVRWKREAGNYLKMRKSDFLTPEFVDFGKTDEVGWVVITYLEAKSLENIYGTISEKDKVSLWRTLGELLANFHKANQVKERDIYLTDSGEEVGLNRIDYYSGLKQNYLKDRDKIKKKDCYNQKTVFLKAFDKIENWFEHTDKGMNHVLCLCHNDFSIRNVMYDSKRKKYCLIDFESAYYAEPEFDFARVLLDLKPCHLDNCFLDGYYSGSERKNDSEKTKIYLLLKIIEICSWSYERAREYFDQAFLMLCKELEEV